MKHPLRITLIFLLLLLLIYGGIRYARQRLMKDHPAGAPAITQKSSSSIDLRPGAIAKLQQLVRNGSDSLYNLRIDSLETDLASGSIILHGVQILPDSAGIRRLTRLRKLPDDVFGISLQRLRITGIGLDDLLHRRDAAIRAIVCNEPQVTVHYRPQPWNAEARRAATHETLFDRLKKQIDRLSIDSISVLNAALSYNSAGETRRFKDISILLRDILLDSAAEHDATRILFAKEFNLHAGNISLPAGDSRYDLGIAGLDIAGRQLKITNLTLRPQGGKEAFLAHQKTQIEVYDIKVPALVLNDADWWALLHGAAVRAREAIIGNAAINVYLDKRLPASGSIKRNNFPQQMLTDMGIPVSLRRIRMQAGTLIYKEFTKASERQSSISFTAINAEADNVTNVPAEVSAQPVAHFQGTCLFMNTCPMEGRFAMELPKSRKGAFSAELRMGGIGHDLINTFAEGMGLVRFTSGDLLGSTAHAEGNNDNVHGTLATTYTDLHIAALKTKEDANGRLKKKRIASIAVNGLLIKNNNPAKGEDLRRPYFSLDRTNEGNFFNFLWMGLKAGLLKTIGVPKSLGM